MQRNGGVTGIGDVRAHERETDSDCVDGGRHDPLDVSSNRVSDGTSSTFAFKNRPLEDVIRERAHESDDAVHRGWQRMSVFGSDPRCRKRNEREPKQEMQICPHHGTVDLLRRSQEVVVVIPIDADKNETQDVDEQRGTRPSSPCQFAVIGVLRSNAMIVMMTAITESLNASSR